MLTFKGICGPGRCVLVRVELKGQLPVGFLQVILAHISGHTKNGVEVFSFQHTVRVAGEGQGRDRGGAGEGEQEGKNDTGMKAFERGRF